MDRLKYKVAFVTGVARAQSMAYGIAKVLAREGATIAAVDISDEVFDRVNELQAAGYPATGYKCDLTDLQAVNDVVQKVLDQFEQIDVLVNVAGGGAGVRKTFVEMTEDEWDRVIAVNIKTVFNCCKAVLPNMVERRYGKIVNISSVTGPYVVMSSNTTAYGAGKGAVSAFSKTLALEVAQYKINVNAICPGFVDTGIYGERKGPFGRSIPLGRLGWPEEVGDLVLFLATDDSKYITGIDIIFDGGNIQQELKTTI